MMPQLGWQYEKNSFVDTWKILTFKFISNLALFLDKHFQKSIDGPNLDPEALGMDQMDTFSPKNYCGNKKYHHKISVHEKCKNLFSKSACGSRSDNVDHS